jgi:hypothetical protein
MPSRNTSADAGIAEGDDRPVEIVGEPIPCRETLVRKSVGSWREMTCRVKKLPR